MSSEKIATMNGIVEKKDVIYKLRDIGGAMVKAWEKVFGEKGFYSGTFEVSKGDIFKDAPSADAIVSPANGFGYMDGGIDMAFSRHFGWHLQERLQEVIRRDYDGELLVGQAVIIPIMESGEKEPKDAASIQANWVGCNEGKPIKYLISAPTMRTPRDVSNTPNAYLAFRAIIIAVDKHNRTPGNDQIRSVLCPGLGTAVGKMPADRCAYQMMQAYEGHVLNSVPEVKTSKELKEPMRHEVNMRKFGEQEPIKPWARKK